jgi:hypothetical protein
MFFGGVEELHQLGDRFHPRRMHLIHGGRHIGVLSSRGFDPDRFFSVSSVSTAGTDHEAVFAYRGFEHELM